MIYKTHITLRFNVKKKKLNIAWERDFYNKNAVKVHNVSIEKLSQKKKNSLKYIYKASVELDDKICRDCKIKA